MSAALSFSHGANDGQKSMGVIAALLLAAGQIDTFDGSVLGRRSCGAVLALGTALGGWRIVRTVGRGSCGWSRSTVSRARRARLRSS